MKTLVIALVLLQSYDEAIKKIATDAETAETASAKVAVGDEFVKLLGKYPKKRAEIVDSASLWYGKAWPDLDDVWKGKLRPRLGKLYTPAAPGKGGAIPQGWGAPVETAHKTDIVSMNVHSGGLAARFTPGKNGKNESMLRSPTMGIKGSKPIEFSVWILTDGTESLDDKVAVYISDAQGKLLEIKTFLFRPDIPVWSKLGGTFDAHVDAARLSVEFLVISPKGFVLADDISAKQDGKEVFKNGSFEEK